MPITVEFASEVELRTVFLTSWMVKFADDSDTEIYEASSIFADGLERLLAALDDNLPTAGDGQMLHCWRRHYVISKHALYVPLLTDRALAFKRWPSLTREERIEHLRVLASPFQLDEEGIKLFDPILRTEIHE